MPKITHAGRKALGCVCFFLIMLTATAQQTYIDSLQAFQADYVKDHEVVTGDDKKLMQFFPVDETFRVLAAFEKVKNAKWFPIETSSGRNKIYRQYGKISFKINDSLQTLYIYQSQSLLENPKYWDHLFLPFTDKTTGAESYETGRYIDLKTTDIYNGKVLIDFNKAYNPYCAYVSGKYSCPVPPVENRLTVAIKAGEKKYVKAH